MKLVCWVVGAGCWVLGAGCLVLGAHAVAAAAPAQILVDRLAAVVGGEPILLSDVREAVRLRLLNPEGPLAPAGAGSVQSEEEALDHLINRRLVLAEIARYLQTLPSPAEIDAMVADWRRRAPDLEPNLRVRAFLGDSLRIRQYVDQRFTAAAQPTRDEVMAYYDSSPSRFAEGGVTPAFAEVEDEARARLAEDRRLALVRTWLRDLRERGQVRVLRPPGV